MPRVRRRPLLLAILLALLAAAPVLRAETIRFDRFDKNHSTVGFRVPILGGLSQVEGKFTDFEIVVVYDEEEPARSTVTAVIRATSIDTGIADRDDHLRSGDFFAAAEHPEIRFESRRVEAAGDGLRVYGPLTLRGVTKEVTLPVTIAGLREEPDKNSVLLGASTHLTLDRQDYGVAWKHPADPLFVGDEVTVEIHLISRLTPRAAVAEAAEG